VELEEEEEAVEEEGEEEIDHRKENPFIPLPDIIIILFPALSANSLEKEETFFKKITLDEEYFHISYRQIYFFDWVNYMLQG